MWFHFHKHNLILEWDQILTRSPIDCNPSLSYSWYPKPTDTEIQISAAFGMLVFVWMFQPLTEREANNLSGLWGHMQDTISFYWSGSVYKSEKCEQSRGKRFCAVSALRCVSAPLLNLRKLCWVRRRGEREWLYLFSLVSCRNVFQRPETKKQLLFTY